MYTYYYELCGAHTKLVFIQDIRNRDKTPILKQVTMGYMGWVVMATKTSL